ncbi:MAG: dicarboxylate/amino acid:cation symporter [Gammaproteobacteria bacterium]|jgi:proton glutamate symport protein
MRKIQLHWQILIAIILAVICGLLTGKTAGLFGVSFYSIYDFFGTLFLNGLKMVIVPLIASSIITGIAGIGGAKGLGRLGGKTILFYMSTSLLAILVGLILVNLIQPGIVGGEPIRNILSVTDAQIQATQSRVGSHGAGSIVGVLLSMLPVNIVKAAADGQMLGLIVFSLFFGYFMTRISEDYAEAQYNFWQGLFEIMMKITELVIRFAPYGVFALVAKVVAGFNTHGNDIDTAIKALSMFSLTVLLGLAIHFFVTLPILLRVFARVNPLRHYRAMVPALLTAFSTASSSATLPMTMECVEKNARVSNRTSSFVLPLGATVNMDGTALYECVVAIFVFQAFGIDLSFSQQFLIVFTALLTSIGVAGIPSASLIAIMIILRQVGLPEAQAAAGLAMVLVVDRVLDMCRTSLNVFSDSCGAVIIARSEGEEGVLAEEPTAS